MQEPTTTRGHHGSKLFCVKFCTYRFKLFCVIYMYKLKKIPKERKIKINSTFLYVTLVTAF